MPFVIVDDGTGKPPRWFGSWKNLAALMLVVGVKLLLTAYITHQRPFQEPPAVAIATVDAKGPAGRQAP